ncbi:MAG TPA: hypothetical protein VFI23_15960 [Rhizomicrobium sp.]|nr:hypothetical protein [Rhizomicrobium sp.]
MDWNALLAEFRALGGDAENITLRQGPRGRGVFPVDPAKPVRLFVPPNLLVRGEDSEIRNGRFVAKASASLGARERAFFDSYQENFSWGAGAFDDLWQTQLAWSQLPQNVRDALKAIWPVKAADFSEPSEELCHKRYLSSRVILFREHRVIMPIVELINHASDGAEYDRTDGIAVEGLFDGEVLAAYGTDDCWGTAVTHGFCEARNHAHSLPGSFSFADYRIKILRTPRKREDSSGVALPIVTTEGDTVQFSFLTLGNARSPHLPRAVFLHIMETVPVPRPDELFDIIQHYNRVQFLKFLRGSEGAATPLAAMLRIAAYQQLETLSRHWGDGSLAAGPASP